MNPVTSPAPIPERIARIKELAGDLFEATQAALALSGFAAAWRKIMQSNTA